MRGYCQESSGISGANALEQETKDREGQLDHLPGGHLFWVRASIWGE